MLTGHDSSQNMDTFDSNIYQRHYSTCAIRSQEIVLRDFGIQIPEDELAHYAYEKGWYSGTGTTMKNIGNILEECGVHVHSSVNNSVSDLMHELKEGHRVIVCVDSKELYAEPGSKEWEFFNSINHPDHALIVAGLKIDPLNHDNDMVVLTDPGKGNAYIEYPLDHFVDAWGDARCFMMATNDAAPYQYNEVQHTMEMSNFASDFILEEFPFHNEFDSIYEISTEDDFKNPAENDDDLYTTGYEIHQNQYGEDCDLGEEYTSMLEN